MRRFTTSSRRWRARPNFVRDNEDFLDTEFKGVGFTASKRFSSRWQMVGGLSIGKNDGRPEYAHRLAAGRHTGDLNDPEQS